MSDAMARLRDALLRRLMRLAPAVPRSDDLDLAEIFAHPSFAAASPAERRAKLLASAELRQADEGEHPFDRYFGRELAPLLNGASVLDLGCFTGGRSMSWIERYRLRGLWGIDVHPPFVAGAQLFARERGAPAHFVCAVGEALPFASARFDAILSFDVFEHVQDLERVLDECRRVLRPGGRLLAVFPPYWHPTEHHLGLVTRVPCLHWFFSGQELVRAYDRVIRERGEGAAWYRRSSPELLSWERGHTLNGTTVRGFETLVARSGLAVVAWPVLPIFRVGRLVARYPLLGGLGQVFGVLARLPGIRELVSHRVVAILERPRGALDAGAAASGPWTASRSVSQGRKEERVRAPSGSPALTERKSLAKVAAYSVTDSAGSEAALPACRTKSHRPFTQPRRRALPPPRRRINRHHRAGERVL
jgi:SAM-dependent methyltransferase